MPLPSPAPLVRAAVAAMLLAAAGCTSKTEKAVQYEQLADQMVAVAAYPAALGAMQTAVALDSNSADRWVKLGRVQRQLDQIAPAANSYQRALDLAPDNTEALQAISVLLVRGGQYDLAKGYAATLAVLSPDDIGGLLTQGAIALHERRLIDADKLADRVMTLAPSLSEGFILKARVLESRGEVPAAAALLTRRLPFDRKNVDLAGQVLRLDRRLGDRAGVRAVSLQLAALVPGDPRYQLEASRALRARGDVAGADRLLDAIGRRWVNNGPVLLGLGHEWLNTRSRAAAIARIAALAGGAAPGIKAVLANLLVEVGEPAQALAVLQPALGTRVDAGTVDVRAAAARAVLAQGQAAAAGRRADEVLAFDERNAEALLVRAEVAAGRHDYRQALDDAQLVMAEEPQNRLPPLLIARFWAAQGNAVLADKAYGTAQARFPDDFGVHRERIRWLLGQGRAGDAAALATSFVVQHGGARDALALMAEACTAAHDLLCSAQARQSLAKG